jgi:hypothetical protein
VPGFVDYKKGCTQLVAASDKIYQLLANDWWFSPGTPVLVIGLYELLGNPTTYLIEPPGPFFVMKKWPY